MKGKIAIVGIVVIVGGFLLLSNPLNLFPIGPEVADTIKQDLTDFTKDTNDKLDNAMDNSLSAINDNINNLKKSSTDFLSKHDKVDETVLTNLEGDIFFGKIKDKETTKTPPNNIGSSGGGGGSSNGNNGKTSPTIPTTINPTLVTSPTIIQTPAFGEIPFDTLSLITKKQSDNNVMMKYKDTSGKTISVTVIMRNEQKVLFTGQFFSSSFETVVLDASDTPHFIDLVVEHSVYGKITATAFNPAGNTDTSIYGVFTTN